MERNKQKHFKDIIPFCLGIVLIILLVQAAGMVKADRLVFPDVGQILQAFLHLLGEKKTYLRIFRTLLHLAEALAISSLAGIALGLLQGLVPFLRQLFRPLMTFLRAIPMIVMAIMTMVLLPYEAVPVTATALILVPLFSEAVCEGCLAIDRELIDVYRMNSDLNFKVVLKVYLPLLGGYLRQAYTNAVGMGIKLTVTTEYLVQARESLGKAVFTSAYFSEYGEIYAYALIMIGLVILVSALPEALAKAVRRIRTGSRT